MRRGREKTVLVHCQQGKNRAPTAAILYLVWFQRVGRVAPLIRQLWEAMAEPRFVIAVGAGAISGAPFGSNYAVDGGVDKIVPVDLYIPGDPPRPEQIIAGIETLAARISSGEVAL